MDLTNLLSTREGLPSRHEATRRHPLLTRRLQRRLASLSCWVPRLQRVRTLEGHRGCVNTIQWSPNGDFLISGSDDTKLKIWDMARLKKVTTLSPGHSANVFCAHFLPLTNEEQVASCGADGNIIVTHVPSVGSDERPHVRHLFTCHDSMVNKIVVDPNDSNLFFSCGDDGAVRRFDRRVQHECRGMGESCDENIFIDLTNGDKYTKHNVGLNALSINPSTGLQIATAGSDPFVRLYDIRKPTKPFRTFRPSWRSQEVRKARRSGPSLYMPYPHLTSLAFDQTGTELLASYGGDYIYLLELTGGAPGEVTAVDTMDLEDPSPAVRRPKVTVRRCGRRRENKDDDDDDEGEKEEDDGDDEGEEGGEGMNSQPTIRNRRGGGKRKRTRSAERKMHTEEKEKEEESEIRQEREREEGEEDEEEEEEWDEYQEEQAERNTDGDDDDDDGDGDDEDDDGEEREEAAGGAVDEDDDDFWGMDDDGESELEEDPRILHPEVSVEYARQWQGHLNVRTVKEVNFFGPRDQYVISGSDDGNIFIWDKHTGKLVQLLEGDASIVNCVQGHPLGYPTLAASGIDHDIKVFMPVAEAACSLDHAQEIMNKNTHTLEHGRSLNHSVLSEEMMDRLVSFVHEDNPDAQLRQNCLLS